MLVSGDSDFVPAAKLARREGIDFILDPMWAGIRSDLHEHIDGLRTVLPRPKATSRNGDEAPTASGESPSAQSTEEAVMENTSKGSTSTAP